MSVSKRIAVTLAAPSVQSTIDRVSWAEKAGYTDAWFAGGNCPDSLTTAAVLGHTSRAIRIGLAVEPVFTRSPAVFAASVNAVGQMLPGRFVMGFGSSSHTMMEGWNGIKFEKPIARVRETALMVRSMLRGEKSSFDGETLKSHGYRQMPMENPPPIYLAALRPKMIEMAAEIGDGVIFNLWPKGALPKMMEHVAIGAKRAGKNPEDVEVVHRAMVMVTDDKQEARKIFRAQFGPYYATPVYNKFLAWAGYEEAAEAVREGFAARDRARTSAAMTDAMIDEIAIIGTADECRERMREDMAVGIDTPIVSPLGRVEETLEAFSADNFPLR